MSESSQNNRNREFFELYGQSQTRILSFLFAMVHNESDAQDLLQDTAAAMLENFSRFERGSNFTAWGITIARNKALNFLRKNSKSRPLLNPDLYTRIAELEMSEMEEEERLAERLAVLKKCRKKLDGRDQEILSLKYYQGYPMSKIAEVLGRSKTGIYHTLARIHNLLYRCIQNNLATGRNE
ncbi:RNA polymerase sigma factor YlaC [Anaerohalosphaera lusitana]|uniref:RNA polymerase sigma factor YlaC n=1 Tax=Anaerohalosphaera lusitana TaxID=1936003 RepID=A0A1U9NQ56_9BACT|nr:sigma-70 family RNA polymerase sigma factor [Anaerohalosphaera lusitana]AQT70039.1 RNA polymerase sigma factor YlaC [Anaerohalosphaera lusitana]